MDKIITQLEKRNFVLNKAFDTNGSPMQFDFNKFFAAGLVDSGQKNGIKEQEYRCIAKQLIADGYLFVFKRDNHVDVIFPTIKGEDIYINGGFVEKYKIDKIKEHLLELDANERKTYARRLLCATLLAGIAGMLLFLIELYKLFYCP